MYGVSYDGLTTAMALLQPHPALKAMSEQAAPVDQWMNDDMHHYGALRESYAFEYAVLEQADKNKNTHFDFDVYDTYLLVSRRRSAVRTLNARFLHDAIPFWNDIVAHPDYDEFWKREAWIRQLHASTVPNLNVAGFFDQEDPWGPWQIFRHAAEHDPDHTNFMVAGPWYHGQWRSPKGDQHRRDSVRRTRNRARVPRDRSRRRSSATTCTVSGEKPAWRATTFQSGANRWQTYAEWPPIRRQADQSLPSLRRPAVVRSAVRHGAAVSRVRLRSRPTRCRIANGPCRRPTRPATGARGRSADQRFVDGRPDVLTFVSAPLEHDLTITGEVAADLFASTSGTDSDFVVKLIDVFPEDAQKNAWDAEDGPQPGQYARSLNGYELPVAMEVRRGRYNQSYETPAPLEPGVPTEWKIPLRDRDHVFRARTPADGAGPVHVVPGDRPQPAAVRAEHLPGDGRRFRHGHPARVLHAGDAVASRAAGHALTLPANVLKSWEAKSRARFRRRQLLSASAGQA